MADIALNISASVEIDGVTFAISVDESYTMTAPEKAYAEIVTTSTTVTDIDIGTELTFTTLRRLGLQNLSTTVGENIGIWKGGILVSLLEPGQAVLIPTAQDGVAYRWDAVAGTPRLAVVAYGPMS